MQARTQELMSFFQSYGGVARFSAILKVGFHPDSLLSALGKEGKVKKSYSRFFKKFNHLGISLFVAVLRMEYRRWYGTCVIFVFSVRSQEFTFFKIPGSEKYTGNNKN